MGFNLGFKGLKIQNYASTAKCYNTAVYLDELL